MNIGNYRVAGGLHYKQVFRTAVASGSSVMDEQHRRLKGRRPCVSEQRFCK